jgi:hypothetical protein
MLDSLPSNEGLFNHNGVAWIFMQAWEVGCPNYMARGCICLSPRAKPSLNPNMPPFEHQLGQQTCQTNIPTKPLPLGLCSELGYIHGVRSLLATFSYRWPLPCCLVALWDLGITLRSSPISGASCCSNEGARHSTSWSSHIGTIDTQTLSSKGKCPHLFNSLQQT